MRRYARSVLPDDVVTYLQKKQAEVDGGKDARTTWEHARRTQKIGRVVAALKGMTGVRARCMYCEDSRGTDIDHFYPLNPHEDRTFLWANLLWNCTDCGRHKTNRFPTDSAGAPLLIDPTVEDPWDFLYYDTGTGNITARFDAATGSPTPKGESTISVLIETIEDEAVVDGRLRTQRNLFRAVRSFLRHVGQPEARGELLESLRDNDGYGLLRWYFVRDGRDEAPFPELRALDPALFREIEGSVA